MGDRGLHQLSAGSLSIAVVVGTVVLIAEL
jgi:hypothetical protein